MRPASYGLIDRRLGDEEGEEEQEEEEEEEEEPDYFDSSGNEINSLCET